jgi:methyl coenzyme M reductase gamma subunit
MMSTNKDDRNEINKLDIANGLKEMLISHQFTVEKLRTLSAEDLSKVLGIDDPPKNIECREDSK